MPSYNYCCQDCGHVFEAFRKIAHRRRGLACPICGGTAKQTLVAEAVAVDDGLLVPSARGYWESAGRSFTTKKELREYCEQNGKIAVYLEGDPNEDHSRKHVFDDQLDFRRKKKILLRDGVPEADIVRAMTERDMFHGDKGW